MMGEELLRAPEGFMGAQVDRSYLLYEEKRRHPSSAPTINNMDIIPITALEKPRRYNRPELERFFSELVRQQNSFVLMVWEYIIRNNKDMDEIKDRLFELGRRQPARGLDGIEDTIRRRRW